MKVTFVATVYNEEETIDAFISSILKQTKLPDEIIIVDGRSNDTTLQKLKKYKKNICITQKKGNRSVGRNEGIKIAKHPIIAVSDAGCLLKSNWVEKITAPFKNKDIDVVSGYYKPVTTSLFEEALATYTCVMPDTLNEAFNPSSRSIAFHKSAWKKVGGYPEYLDTCEDMVFVKKLRNAGMTFYLEKNAIVYWKQQKSISQAFKQFYMYAYGDGKARYFRTQTPFLFLRYVVGFSMFIAGILVSSFYLLILLLLFILYLLWAIHKNHRYISTRKGQLYLPLLQLTSDLAVLLGTSSGFISSVIYKR